MKNNVMQALLFVGMLFFAVGCSNDSAAEEPVEVEREELELLLEKIDFDAEWEEITIQFTTNLPEETVVDTLALLDSNNTAVLELEVQNYSLQDSTTVVFELGEKDREGLPEEELSMVLTVFVDETTNTHFLSNEVIGGSFSDMQMHYADSELLQLSAGNQPNAYSFNLRSSNKKSLPEEIFEKAEEVVEEEEPTVEETAEAEVEVEPEPEPETKVETSEFQLVTTSDLKNNFDAFFGMKIEVKGEVTQVIQYDPYAMSDTAQSYLVNISDPNNYNADNSVWVEILSNPPTLFEGSKVTVKGTLLDTYTYESVMGTPITVPYILASSIE
ncbi:hypothetical protein J2S74_000450 [Evansella vedderi]|uniref:Lipoprotein n=1 Tax=Evansella vedderi TaxID=38282 RepID=A0ABT9ZPB4_9BACI|nr:hypothetical protein [Evansella vedderi]MDQ0253078.1 hypothetical protein [Evansella vedderi]